MKSDWKDIKSAIEVYDILMLSDLSIVAEIQRMQDVFSDATGVASLITFPDGTPITKPSNFCRLCEMVRSTEKGLANCIKSDECIGKNISNEIFLEPCKSAGLWDAGSKIIVHNNHIANWLIGQVRNDEVNVERILEYGDEIGIERSRFQEALNEVPVMTVARFEKVAKMLDLFVNELTEKIFRNNELKNQVAELERLNELLHKSQESMAITLNSIGDAVISTDKEGLIVSMNPIAENLCGWTLSEASGKLLTDVFRIKNSKTGLWVDNPVDKVLSGGKIIGLANHTVLISKDGKEYQISDSAAPIKNKEGEISGVVLVFSDVTEKYKVEIELEKSEQYLKETQLIAQLGTYTTDILDGKWTSSEILDSIFGIGKDDDRTVNGWISIIHPDWRDKMNDYFANEVVAKKSRFDKEYKIIRKSDKKERWVHGLGKLIFDDNGIPIKMIGTIQDITYIKEAEEKLRESEEKYRSIFENVQDIFYKVDLNGVILELSPSAKNYEDFIDLKSSPMHISDLYADVHDREKFLKQIYEDGEIRDYELDLKGKSGEIKHASINAQLVRDSNGNPTHINGALRDINKRKIAENALRKSEQFLLETQAIAMIGNWTINLNTKEWSSSEILDKIFGIDHNTNKNLSSLSKIIHPDWLGKLVNYFTYEILPTNTYIDKKFEIIRLSDQTVRWVHAIGELKFDENNKPSVLIGTIQDITERKVTTDALRKSEELYRSILNASPDDITVTDLTGKIIVASPVAYKIFGFNHDEEIIGHNILENIIPEDQSKALNDIQLIANGVTLGPQIYRSFHTNGNIVETEVNFEIIKNTEGNPYGFVFVVRDIAERRKTEETLLKSKEELKNFASHLQTVREEERHLLAREIHDDLGQILIAMKIDTGLLKKSVLKNTKSDNSDLKREFDNLQIMIDNTLKSARRIMTDLRPEVLDMLGFTETVKQHLENFQNRFQIDCTFINNTSNLNLDSQQSVALFRIVQEALNNVAKHSGASKVKINLSRKGEKLTLEITDNGIGFDQNEKKNSNSYGLMGMKERIYLLEGELIINSKKNNGTSLKVIMRYPKNLKINLTKNN